MTGSIITNGQIITTVLQSLGYGLIAGFTIYFVTWGVRQVMRILEV